MTYEELRKLAREMGYMLVKVDPGSGWHPNDGPCSQCGAQVGEYCKDDCLINIK